MRRWVARVGFEIGQSVRGSTPVEGASRRAVPCAVFFVDCESGSGAPCAREDASVGFWPGRCVQAWRLWFGAWLGWSVLGLWWVSDPYALRCELRRYDHGLGIVFRAFCVMC